MNIDLLDELLEQSAPRSATPTDELRSELALMASDARREVRPKRRPAVRVAVAAGVALALVTGGGVAVASGLISWEPEYDNPDNAFAFTLPSGRACETRLIVEGGTGGPGPDQTEREEIDAELRSWLTQTDVWSVLDLPGARAVDESLAAQYPNHTVVIADEGWLTDIEQSPDTRSEDDVYAFVVDRALRDAVQTQMTAILDGRTGETEWIVNHAITCEAVTP